MVFTKPKGYVCRVAYMTGGRAYSNGAVHPILCSSKSRMCSPSGKIVQSKICALNFHTNQQQELFSHLLHLQRWQVEAGNLFILQARRVLVIPKCGRLSWPALWSTFRRTIKWFDLTWFDSVAGLQCLTPVFRDTGAPQASDASFHYMSRHLTA